MMCYEVDSHGQVMKLMNKLMCTNHYFVHKSEILSKNGHLLDFSLKKSRVKMETRPNTLLLTYFTSDHRVTVVPLFPSCGVYLSKMT